MSAHLAPRAVAAELLDLVGSRRGTVDMACPRCGPDRKSEANRRRKTLRVWRSDDGFVSWHCARCGDRGWARTETSRAFAASAPPIVPGAPIREKTAEQRTADALAIWNAAVSPVGTLVEHYLAGRGLALPDEVLAGGALRFHSECPFGRARLPCLVALFTDAVTAEPKAIHRTALTADGQKIDRKTLGPIVGAVIRLWPDEVVECGLVLGEGIETTLAASFIAHKVTLLRPAWAAGFAGGMKNFPVLAGVDALTILVDNDESGTGQAAAAHVAARWKAAGREVTRLTPKLPGDFNDVVVVETP